MLLKNGKMYFVQIYVDRFRMIWVNLRNKDTVARVMNKEINRMNLDKCHTGNYSRKMGKINSREKGKG